MGNNIECLLSSQFINNNLAYGCFYVEKKETEIAVVRKSLDKFNILQKKLCQELRSRKMLNDPHLVKLQTYQLKQKGNLIHIQMRYEYCPRSLKDVIQNKLMSNTYFSEQELISIIVAVQKGLRCLYRSNIAHGCINEQTILQSQKGIFKITDVSSTTHVRSYDLAIRGDRNQALSQKMIDLFNICVIPCEVIRHLQIEDDLFSLGLVILAVALKRKVSVFYKYNVNELARMMIQIDYVKIDNYLKVARQKVGKKFAGHVQRLLAVNKQCLTLQKIEQSYLASQLEDNLQEDCDKSNPATNTP